MRKVARATDPMPKFYCLSANNRHRSKSKLVSAPEGVGLTHGAHPRPLIRHPQHIGNLPDDTHEAVATANKKYRSPLKTETSIKEGLVILNNAT